MSTAPDTETVRPRMPSAPVRSLPPGACDTHTHVFGPRETFPLSRPSSYALPRAPFEVHADMLARIGAARAVLVQPAPYATDPSALVDALGRYGGRARGVATAAADTSDREWRALHDAGVRALRFNEVLDRGTGKRFAGSVGIDQLPGLAPRMREMGWHAQVWARCPDVPACAAECARFGVPVVFEHMGSFDVGAGVDGEAFQAMVRLLVDGRVWVKLALCRNSAAAPDYTDLRPFHDALVAANPSRLLWASDWPFVRMGDQSPDVGRLLDVFDDWIGDDGLRQRILVDNPVALYGFTP